MAAVRTCTGDPYRPRWHLLAARVRRKSPRYTASRSAIMLVIRLRIHRPGILAGDRAVVRIRAASAEAGVDRSGEPNPIDGSGAPAGAD